MTPEERSDFVYKQLLRGLALSFYAAGHFNPNLSKASEDLNYLLEFFHNAMSVIKPSTREESARLAMQYLEETYGLKDLSRLFEEKMKEEIDENQR